MPRSKLIAKPTAASRIDFTPLLPAVIRSDAKIKRHLTVARRQSATLRKALESLEGKMKDLESQDKLGNFEIQDLMSSYNQAETLASNLLKKRDDTANAVIAKLG